MVGRLRRNALPVVFLQPLRAQRANAPGSRLVSRTVAGWLPSIAFIASVAAAVVLAGCTAAPVSGEHALSGSAEDGGFASSIDTTLLPPAARESGSTELSVGSGWRRAVRRLTDDAQLPPDHALSLATAPSERLGLSIYTRRRDFPFETSAIDAPRTADVLQRGGASWYGPGFHNRRTASGERFDMAEMTAAHRTLPFGTRVCVLSVVNGREVEVRINDRGPHAPNRIIDLSQGAAQALGMIGLGIKQVALSLPERTGRECVEDTAASKRSTR